MCQKNILIVDDDDDLRLGLATRLRANGYRVQTARDVLTAIHQAEADRPDLVVMEVCLPVGNGILLMDRLREVEGCASLPMVIITGNNPSLLRSEALRHSARDFFQKPVNNQELLASIHNAVYPEPAPGSGQPR